MIIPIIGQALLFRGSRGNEDLHDGVTLMNRLTVALNPLRILPLASSLASGVAFVVAIGPQALAQVSPTPTSVNIWTSERALPPNSPVFYWVPPLKCNIPPVPMVGMRPQPEPSITVPRNGPPNRLNVWNRTYQNVTRRVKVTTNPQQDIVVGSPNSNEIFSGSAGQDVFVVGNGYVRTNFQSIDGEFLGPYGSPEIDQVNLATGTTIDHIYVSTVWEEQGFTGMDFPGEETPQVGDGRLSVNGRNIFNGIQLPQPPANGCLYGQRAGLYGPSLAPFASLGLPAIHYLLSFIHAVPGSLHASWDALSNLLRPFKPTPTKGYPSGVQSFPGVPRIANLQAQAPNNDIIYVPREEYEKEISSPSSIYVVKTSAKLVSKDQCQESVKRNCASVDGNGLTLEQAPTNKYSLFYLQQFGLLVFSFNEKPLGSRANPGRIIAQVVDNAGMPLILRGVQGQPDLAENTFISVVPLNQPDKPACDKKAVRSCGPAKQL